MDIVKNHSYKGNKNYLLKFDCSRCNALDTIGKIRLKRTLKYCKINNIAFVNLNYHLDCEKNNPAINPISVCHYLHNTNFPKYKALHTKTAIKMGGDKTRILKLLSKKALKSRTRSYNLVNLFYCFL